MKRRCFDENWMKKDELDYIESVMESVDLRTTTFWKTKLDSELFSRFKFNFQWFHVYRELLYFSVSQVFCDEMYDLRHEFVENMIRLKKKQKQKTVFDIIKIASFGKADRIERIKYVVCFNSPPIEFDRSSSRFRRR